MMLSITFEGHSVQLLKGTPLKVLYDLDSRIPFQCLKGRCGRCMVRTLQGDLGPRTPEEIALMKSMGVTGSEYRLLCQSTLESDALVERA